MLRRPFVRRVVHLVLLFSVLWPLVSPLTMPAPAFAGPASSWEGPEIPSEPPAEVSFPQGERDATPSWDGPGASAVRKVRSFEGGEVEFGVVRGEARAERAFRAPVGAIEERPQAFPVLWVEASPLAVRRGQGLTVTVTVRNEGDGRLPAGAQVVLEERRGLGEVGRWTLGELAPGAQARFVWNGTVPAEAGEDLLFSARVEADGVVWDRGGAWVWVEGGEAAPGVGTVGKPGRSVGRGIGRRGPAVGSGGVGLEAEGRVLSGERGKVVGWRGRVAVELPAGAWRGKGGLWVRMRPAVGELGKAGKPARQAFGRPLVYPFALEAVDGRGVGVHRFNRALTVTVAYDPEVLEVLGLSEADLQLFWWDPERVVEVGEGKAVRGAWVPVPSRVDVARKVVVGRVNHFSYFTLSDGASASETYLPGLQGFQTSLFTGQASFELPIEVPAGPGGLAPKLTLSYASGATDGGTGQRELQQAGWVGKGWTLWPGEIALVKGRTGNRADDTYTLSLGGATYDLVRGEARVSNPDPTDPADWYWHTTEETFWRIWVDKVAKDGGRLHWGKPYSATVWVVETKDGTKYEFGARWVRNNPGNPDEPFDNRAWWGYASCYGSWLPNFAYLETYRWLLTRVVDRWGNEVQYTYDDETFYVGDGQGLCFHVYGWVTVDVWPTEVRWGPGVKEPGKGMWRVRFVSRRRSPVGQGVVGLDWDAEGVWGRVPYKVRQTRVLDEVVVEGSEDGGKTWRRIRSYKLTYADEQNSVYSDRTCQQGSQYGACPTRKPTLVKVQEFGADGSSALPAWEFAYKLTRGSGLYPEGGWNRLVEARNGYGGKIEFVYDNLEDNPGLDGAFANRHVVVREGRWDGQGNVYTTTYSYAGAAVNDRNHSAVVAAAEDGGYTDRLVHAPRREFRGFRMVTVTLPTGDRSVHEFAQDDDYKGRELRTRLYSGATGKLVEEVERIYGREVYTHNQPVYLGLKWGFVYLKEERRRSYQADGSYEEHRTVYKYDTAWQWTGPGWRQNSGKQWGNLTTVEEYEGGVRVRTVLRGYVGNEGTWVVGLPAFENVYAGEPSVQTLVSSVYYAYDNQGVFAPPVKGKLTGVRRIVAVHEGSPFWVETADERYVYDAYGNKVREERYLKYGSYNWSTRMDDPAWKPQAQKPYQLRTWEYDGTFHVYPLTTTVWVGLSGTGATLTETARYDLVRGWLLWVKDANGAKTEAEYDPFGRVVKVWKPGDRGEGTPSTAVQYRQNRRPYEVAVWRKQVAGAAAWSGGGTVEVTAYDGLGQVIQTRAGTLQVDWFTRWEVVQDFTYDALGRQVRATRPYYGAAVGGYGTPVAWTGTGADGQAVKGSETLYDGLGRVVGVKGPDGVWSWTVYGGWTQLERGRGKKLVVRRSDGLGRMRWVGEFLQKAWDGFNDGASAGWVWGGSVQESGGWLQVNGTNSWGNVARRANGFGEGRLVEVRWKATSGTIGNLFLSSGSWGTSGYRRWGVQVLGGKLYLVTYEGTQAQKKLLLNQVQAGAVYRLVLGVGKGGAEFLAAVWKEGDGRIQALVQREMPSTWWGRTWVFMAQTYRGQIALDWYRHGEVLRTRYGYKGDRLTEVWDAAGNRTQIWYDVAGRKVKMTDPDMGTWWYGYDGVGNLVWQIDARKTAVNLYYDGLGRLKGKTYTTDANPAGYQRPPDPGAAGYAVGYEYDGGTNGKGRRTRTWVKRGNGTIAVERTWTYDARGRVIAESLKVDGRTYSTEYRYTVGDRLRRMRYPDGSWVEYVYDGLGRPVSLKEVGSGKLYVNGAGYLASGEVQWERLGNGVTWTRRYFGPGGAYRLKELEAAKPGVGTVQHLKYTYDRAGNITKLEDLVAKETLNFRYDSLDRLTNVWGAYNGTYSYDAIGNLTWKDGQSYQYTSGKPHAATAWGSNFTLRYDANGNVTQRTVGGQTYAYTYDAENRLTQVSGAASAQFLYDADGVRVKGVVNGVATVYVGDLYEEQKQGGVTTKKKYLLFNGRPVAVETKVDLPRVTFLNYLLTDHLGSTAVVLDGSGGKVGEVRYKAWGETRYTWGTIPTSVLYTGQRQEAALGIYYYRARWYDPALGRFLQPDTIVPEPGKGQAFNRYAYAYNNPIRYMDASGHRAEEGTGQATLDPYYWYDLTYWLVQEANYIVELPEIKHLASNNWIVLINGMLGKYREASMRLGLSLFIFIQLARTGGPWDFKEKIEEDIGKEMRLGGYWFEYSTVGNILYGFYGAAANFPLKLLQAGAGAMQVVDRYILKRNENVPIGSLRTFFDTEDDYYAIEFGYRLYQKAYASDGKLTISEFRALLVQYEHREKMALVDSPSLRKEVNPDWPYRLGYFDQTDVKLEPSWLFPSFGQ